MRVQHRTQARDNLLYINKFENFVFMHFIIIILKHFSQ